MAVITDLIQDEVEYAAKYIKRTNCSVEYGDLVQEGFMAMLSDKVKANQKKAYYKKIAFNAMLKYIGKEKNQGIVVNTHGGDRKSDTFKDQQELTHNVNVVSIDGVTQYVSDIPLHFEREKGIPPDYDNVDYDIWYSDSDAIMENWLKGK